MRVALQPASCQTPFQSINSHQIFSKSSGLEPLLLVSAICLISFFLAQKLYCMDNAVAASSDGLPKALLESLGDYLTGINSLEYTVTKTDKIIDSKPASSVDDSKPNDGFFAYDGGNYRIENRLGTGAWAQWNRIVAMNGHQYQVLHYDIGRLYIQELSVDPKIPSEFPLRYANPFLEPFEFLSGQLFANDFSEFKLSEVALPSNIALLARRVLTIHRDEHQIIVDFKASIEARTQLPSFYRVTFSIDNEYYPINWQRVSEDGRILTEYSIVRLDHFVGHDGKTIVYPGAMLISYFGCGKDKSVSQAPVIQTEYTLHFVSVNKHIDDDVFTIDPTLAETIYDNQTKTLISVPK